MAPSKKQKISKAEKKLLAKEKSKKAHAARGLGTGSRKNFMLPSNWKEKTYDNNKRLRFVSPGKTEYKTQKGVEKALVSRNLKDCFNNLPETSEEESVGDDDSDYVPSSEENTSMVRSNKDNQNVERRLFVCESTQVADLVNQINTTSKCSTKDCNGR